MKAPKLHCWILETLISISFHRTYIRMHSLSTITTTWIVVPLTVTVSQVLKYLFLACRIPSAAKHTLSCLHSPIGQWSSNHHGCVIFSWKSLSLPFKINSTIKSPCLKWRWEIPHFILNVSSRRISCLTQ
jgi:hypothetical protein